MSATPREDGLRLVTSKIVSLLTSALGSAGSGSFMVEYDVYKVGIYRIVLRGTVAFRFYVPREQLTRRSRRSAGGHVQDGLGALMWYLEDTIGDALRRTGFGGFLLKYDIETTGSFRVMVHGTVDRTFFIRGEELQRT